MFDVVKKSIQWGQETLTLETGKVARQADGSVIATLGETSVMANVTFAKEPKPGQDFFPLTVHYQEKYYAAGKVPGGFFKREARPSEKETLTARLIDRPIRPLFAPGFKHEVLVMCTVLSHDLVNDPDIVAMIAASAALTISGVPFMGPIAGARVVPTDVALHVAPAARVPAGAVGGADDDHIAGHDRCGVQPDLAGCQVDLLVVVTLEVDHPVDAELRHRPTGLRVERNQTVARRHVDDAFLLAIGPVCKATPRELAWRCFASGTFIKLVHPQ